MARNETQTARYSMTQLREIVVAGMSITEAQHLLDDGYAPEEVLELARLQMDGARTDGFSKGDLREVLADNTQAMKKALKPENDEHPNISAFHPGGGPIAALPYECYYNNFPIHKAVETQHDRERELFTQLTPGIFRILRKDLSDLTVTVRADTTPAGRVTRLFVEFPVAREEKTLVPPMHVVLYQLVHASVPAKQRYMQAVNEHMETVLGGLEA